MAEKAVVDYLSLTGETERWWHPGQCGSRAGRSTIDTLAFLKGVVAANYKRGRCAALIMTDVAATFPSTSRTRVIKMLIKNKAYPTIIRISMGGQLALRTGYRDVD
jgi:hypothetical protein